MSNPSTEKEISDSKQNGKTLNRSTANKKK